MSASVPHLIPTDRDRLILKILSSLGVASSKTLRRMTSPGTKHKTFLSRLAALKRHGFMKELYWNERMRNQYSIYSLGNLAVVMPFFPEIGDPKPVPSKSSRTVFKHRLLLGDFIADTLDTIIRKNNPTMMPNLSDIRWSDYLRSRISKWRKGSSVPDVHLPVPDFVLSKWNRIFAFELQNRSSNRQLQAKVWNYEFLRLRKSADRMFPIFKNREVVLCVGLRDARKISASAMMKEYGWKKLLKSIEDFG